MTTRSYTVPEEIEMHTPRWMLDLDQYGAAIVEAVRKAQRAARKRR